MKRKGIWIQGIQLPPRHSRIHVPGRWFHQPQRNRRQVNLWTQISRRKLQAETHRPGNLVHGQRRAQHQWIPVLFVHGRYCLVGWKARCLWESRGGNGRRPNGRNGRIRIWKDQRTGYCWELRTTCIKKCERKGIIWITVMCSGGVFWDKGLLAPRQTKSLALPSTAQHKKNKKNRQSNFFFLSLLNYN